MQIVIDYIKDSYMTLMLLAGMAVILIANRRAKIEGTQYLRAIMGIVFALTVFEYLEKWCDKYGKPVEILYFKAAFSYSLYPLIIILELFLIARIKHKLLLIPYFIELPFFIADLFGTGFVYGYNENHSFASGKLNFLPAAVLCFYIALLMIYSVHLIRQREYSKAMIAVFVSASSIITTLLEYFGVVTGHTTEIAALEILIYYFYLAAIQHSEVQRQLAESEIALVKEKMEMQEVKTSLLLGQMKPHFVQNCLVTIRNLCRKDSAAAIEAINHFSRYLRRSMTVMDTTQPIQFEQEMELVDHYLYMEQLRFGEDVKVEKDIQARDFCIPALTVEPVVENAVRHGIRSEKGMGTVKISSAESETEYTVTVEDDGTGFDTEKLNSIDSEHIGLKNVRSRLQLMVNGTVEIESRIGEGTKVTLRIPKGEQQ